MREFLPYKHYRVLDSQWTSCCSAEVVRIGTGIAGRLQGVTGGVGPGGTTVLLPRPYAFNLTVSEASDGGDQNPGSLCRCASTSRVSGRGGTDIDERQRRARAVRQTCGPS